jgi:GNAT superfamily N-acetyltransferase
VLESTTARLLVIEMPDRTITGYVLAFIHPTFYASAPVAWVEEIMVAEPLRRSGLASALMAAIKNWARGKGARLIALATRRAAGFYEAIDYEESATYFRKLI